MKCTFTQRPDTPQRAMLGTLRPGQLVRLDDGGPVYMVLTKNAEYRLVHLGTGNTYLRNQRSTCIPVKLTRVEYVDEKAPDDDLTT